MYLGAPADGIVSSKVLQKYIGKKNSDWVKLYRYVWLKSQAIHLAVFVSPKTFALATCTDHAADEDIRRAVVRGAVLPPAKTSDPGNFLITRSEGTIIITDIPMKWKSNSGIENDLPSSTFGWGCANIQQHTPRDYSPKVAYLEQPCKTVANLIENAGPEEELRKATIHVWVSMTDLVDYAGTKGGSESFTTKDSTVEINSYFMKCFQKLTEAGKAKNPYVININANGEFLNCNDLAKFQRVTKDVVTELRGKGYMVSWGGPLWRELHPFRDAHGRVKTKGSGEKQIAVGAMEKRLFRETLLKRMFSPQKVSELDHLSTASGIAKNEGLIDEPPDEYKYEDVNAIPLGPNSTLGKSGKGRKVRTKMHVPNWDDQPRASIQPSLVSDEKFFCIEVDHEGRDENDEDPMAPLRGIVTSVPARVFRTAVRILITRGAPLCSQWHFESIWRGY